VSTLAETIINTIIRHGWVHNQPLVEIAAEINQSIGWVSQRVADLGLPPRGPLPMTGAELAALRAIAQRVTSHGEGKP